MSYRNNYNKDHRDGGYEPDFDEEVNIEIEPGKKYSKGQLNEIADEILRQDARSELCRVCDARGEETGEVKAVAQEATDDQGRQIALEFPQYKCENGHEWFEGEGKTRSIQGNNPILFEEHLQQRRKREIYTVVGTPDPSIVAGIYNRTHPQGRKVNSAEQRKRNGASWYR